MFYFGYQNASLVVKSPFPSRVSVEFEWGKSTLSAEKSKPLYFFNRRSNKIRF